MFIAFDRLKWMHALPAATTVSFTYSSAFILLVLRMSFTMPGGITVGNDGNWYMDIYPYGS